MKETQLQKVMCDAVIESGGYAKKLSHKFVSGVPDTLIKLPHGPAMLLEAKQRRLSSADAVFDARFTLDVTKLQDIELRDAWRAGMVTGVVSFIQVGTGSGFKLWMAVIPWPEASGNDYLVIGPRHRYIGTSSERNGLIIEALQDFGRCRDKKERT